MTVTWLSLELRRRWRSLIVLGLLVALTTGTVLAAVAGARRGQTAFDRLWARTLPATVTVLANQPGFDWSKVEALPEVSATALFIVYYGATVAPSGARPGSAAPTWAFRRATRACCRRSSGRSCSRGGCSTPAEQTR